MATTKAQQKAVAKYENTNYDKVLLRLEKGRREVLKAHAEARGESLNAFIVRAVNTQMERDNDGEAAEG